ncbi:molybdate ABC transporter substrate-binding protein [Roseomonas sp. F4]
MFTRRWTLVAAGLLAPMTVRSQPVPTPIYAAGAVKHAVEELQAMLRSAGRPVPDASFDTVGALRDRILQGERPALTLLSAAAIETLVQRGLVRADGVSSVGRTGVALAAPAGRPAPDISTVDALRAALLATDSLAVADPARGATAGQHFMAVLNQLGIAEAMRPKLRLVPFGVVGVEMASRGEIALAVSQATEVIDRPGVQLVGLLPDALQLWTEYRAAIVQDGDEARQLLALFQGEAAKAAFERIGFRRLN